MRQQKMKLLILLLCLAPMLMFAWIGLYARPQSDDLCHIVDASMQTVWEAVLIKRSGINGSSANIVVMNLLGPLDIHVTALFPTLLIASWFATSAALLNKTLALLNAPRSRTIAVSASALLISAACAGFYTLRSVYWYTASVKYGLPMTLVTVYLLLLLHVITRPPGKGSAWRLTAFGAALCFAAANFAEAMALLMILSLTLLLGVVWLAGDEWRRRCFSALAAGWVGSAAAILAMLTTPALLNRGSASIRLDSLGLQMSSAADKWLDRITDPSLLPSFALMVAAGILIGMALPSSPRAQHGSTSAIPARIALLIQALLLPIILNHQSFDAGFLGRYSLEYTVIIAANVALIGLFALSSRRKSAEGLHNISWLPKAGLAIALLIIVLLTTRGMQWQSYLFLWLTLHSLLLIVAGQLSLGISAAVLRRFIVGMVVLYAMICLGGLALSIAISFFVTNYQGRIYTFIPFLVVWGGLAWGVYFGWGFKLLGGSLHLVRIGSLLVALWLGGGILANTLSVAESFRYFANVFDQRHEQILAIRATGLRDIQVPQPPLDLKTFLREVPREVPCLYTYYDIDSLAYIAGD